jgi:hypothetical protein
MLQLPAKAVPAFTAGKAFQERVHTSAAPSGDAAHGASRRADGVALSPTAPSA